MRGPSLSIQGRAKFEGLPARVTLARWVLAALDSDAELTLRFVDAREGRRLNRDFGRKDHATNVLTFAYQAPPRVRADIVICVPVVRREARTQGKTFRDHLAHLVVHGVLHAQGHDHRTKLQASRMEGRELAVLASLGVRDPYRATAGSARSDR